MGLRWPVPSMRPRAPCFFMSLPFDSGLLHTHTRKHPRTHARRHCFSQALHNVSRMAKKIAKLRNPHLSKNSVGFSVCIPVIGKYTITKVDFLPSLQQAFGFFSEEKRSMWWGHAQNWVSGTSARRRRRCHG